MYQSISPRSLLTVLLITAGAIHSYAATINVSSHGGYPDDGLDDTAAINSAINTAGALDVIVFSSGTYDLITEYDADRFIRISTKDDIPRLSTTALIQPPTRKHPAPSPTAA